MARHCTLALLIGLAALFGAVPGLPGQEKKDADIKGWGTWIDPDGDCKVAADGGKRTGNKLTFSISQEADAKTWTEIHTDDAELPKDLQVGVLAINTTTSVFAPELHAFKVSAK
jgi:hypothetical protein